MAKLQRKLERSKKIEQVGAADEVLLEEIKEYKASFFVSPYCVINYMHVLDLHDIFQPIGAVMVFLNGNPITFHSVTSHGISARRPFSRCGGGPLCFVHPQ